MRPVLIRAAWSKRWDRLGPIATRWHLHGLRTCPNSWTTMREGIEGRAIRALALAALNDPSVAQWIAECPRAAEAIAEGTARVMRHADVATLAVELGQRFMLCRYYGAELTLRMFGGA